MCHFISVQVKKISTKKTTRVDLVLKSSHDLFEENQDNVISIEIDPENKLTVTLNGKQLSQTDLSSLQMKFAYTQDEVAQIPDAYEKLFYDFLIGDRTNFVHWHEVKTTWDFIDRIEKKLGKKTHDNLLLIKMVQWDQKRFHKFLKVQKIVGYLKVKTDFFLSQFFLSDMRNNNCGTTRLVT